LLNPRHGFDSKKPMKLKVDDFRPEIEKALKRFDKYVVCIEKTPDDAQQTLRSLMAKAIHAYETRAAGLRHGVALDRHLTIILSENDGERPLCGIYFNLHSPYQKK
jgi:hypothetical protein